MKPNVLIADGNPVLCCVYVDFIAAHGYRVDTATNGLDCLAKLRQMPPAALVLDLELRWGGGDGVLAWLREEKATAGVGVILTGYPATVASANRPPGTHFLLKPFGLTALLDSIRAAVASGQAAAVRAGRNPAWWTASSADVGTCP